MQATQRAVANHVKFMDNSDTESDDEPYYEVNTITPDGRIVQEGILQRMSDVAPVSEDDFVVHRMTGDRLREYRAKHCGTSTPASREESRLRHLDKMRRGYEMMFPGKPCIMDDFGDMDIYLKRKIEELKILKLKEGQEDLEGRESGDANQGRGPFLQRRPYYDVT